MKDEHREAVSELRTLRSCPTRVWNMVLKRPDEMPPLAASLSLAVDQAEGRVDTAATNGVH
jgi:hypothetical protein